MEDNSVDSIVTDPPYGLKFMNKHWDYDVPAVDVWRECLRVLKPGGHALIACGTRTQHRMAVNIEDAGFEIRDVITWLYGSGFPKSLDVSKAIDKAAGAEREVVATIPDRWTGKGNALNFSTDRPQAEVSVLGEPSTDAAKQWQGWGTALKPACEFWTLARKPLGESTVAKNVQRWGTGGINVDGCRVEAGAELKELNRANKRPGDGASGFMTSTSRQFKPATGRFPANLILDEEAALQLDLQTGELKSGMPGVRRKPHETSAMSGRLELTGNTESGFGDSGGASRFFYTAKASKSERNAGCEGLPEKDPPGSKRSAPAEGRESALGAPRANHHPTVKPIKLMRYLCRLITPPKGIVLDPFMGSGSTGVAAKQEGFDFIGIEREAEYVEIAKRRIA